jgi:hypothetical protein
MHIMKGDVLCMNTHTLALEMISLKIDWTFVLAASMISDVLSIYNDNDSVVFSTFMSAIPHSRQFFE